MLQIDGEISTNTFLLWIINFLNINVLISTTLGKLLSRHQSEVACIDFHFYDVIAYTSHRKYFTVFLNYKNAKH